MQQSKYIYTDTIELGGKKHYKGNKGNQSKELQTSDDRPYRRNSKPTSKENSSPKVNDEAQKWLDTLNDSKHIEYTKQAISSTTAYSNVYLEELKQALHTVDNPMYKTTQGVYKNDVCVCAKAAITRNPNDKICVLNFASYHSAGGGFLTGAHAQEEDLCRMTDLYPALSSKKGWYDSHEGCNPLYTDDYIYTKDATFWVNGKPYKADILTIAAPNVRAYKGDKDTATILMDRQEVAFLVPILNGCNIFLTGAFGCGVFGNDASEVAKNWKALSERYEGYYKNISYAVLDSNTFKTFKNIIGG